MTGIVANGAKLDELAVSMRGKLLRPGEDGYDTARKIWNGMIDRRPALIARCAGAADVIHAVNFAREQNLAVAVKGGGHSFPGLSVCDDGLMIDLSPMKSVRVDPVARTVRAEPGVTWGEFDRETHGFGLAVTGGQISHTGIAGLTLGGGFGWLARSFGLSSDNLLSVDIVTADGKLLKASESENAELFWGVRGGGGNFGIVTSFEYRLYPVSIVLAGLVAHPLPRAHEALRFFRDFARQAPNELMLTGAFIFTPDGHPAFGIAMCYNGDLAEGERVIRPLREFGPPVMEQVGVMPYPVVQTLLDHAAEPGRRYYMQSHLLDDISDEAMDIVLDRFSAVPSPLSGIIIPQLGGAISQRPKDATAYAHRDAAYDLIIMAGWTDAAEDEPNIRWARDLGAAVRPHASGGVYVNGLWEEGDDRIRAAYGADTYRRLAALKYKYDPANLFRMNQNIKPME